MNSCLAIDNGSGLVKAGWNHEDKPKLVFDTVVTKSVKDKANQQASCYVGFDGTRSKSPFEEGLLVNADLMEKILDHVFYFSGVSNTGLHQVLMTEPMCNPQPCRDILAELLFEAYDVQNFSLGVDAAFSLYQNHPSLDFSGSILSISHSFTHTIPYVEGKPLFHKANRLNIGCGSMVRYMQHLIQTKYPDFPHFLSRQDFKKFIYDHCYYAVDYSNELNTLLNSDDRILPYPLTEYVNPPILEKVKLTPEEQTQLETDRNNFLQSIVEERDSKRQLVSSNRSKSIGGTLRKKDETQHRMRAMASLLEGDEEEAGSSLSDKKRQRKRNLKSKDDEAFGDAEEDWIVYNQLSKEPKPEAQDETIIARLARLDRILAEYDPYRIFQKPKQDLLTRLAYGPYPLIKLTREQVHQRRHELRFNLERIRVPELIFAPHMLGVDMRGAHELLLGEHRIFCTGGGSKLPGLQPRLTTMLQQEVPTGTTIEINIAEDPILDTWKGMTKAYASGLLNTCTKEEYMETGSCFKFHPWSNPS